MTTKQKVKKLYEIEKGSKIFIGDKVFIFDHLDGMYSYCYNEMDMDEVLHLRSDTPLVDYLGGYEFASYEH